MERETPAFSIGIFPFLICLFIPWLVGVVVVLWSIGYTITGIF